MFVPFAGEQIRTDMISARHSFWTHCCACPRLWSAGRGTAVAEIWKLHHLRFLLQSFPVLWFYKKFFFFWLFVNFLKVYFWLFVNFFSKVVRFLSIIIINSVCQFLKHTSNSELIPFCHFRDVFYLKPTSRVIETWVLRAVLVLFQSSDICDGESLHSWVNECSRSKSVWYRTCKCFCHSSFPSYWKEFAAFLHMITSFYVGMKCLFMILLHMLTSSAITYIHFKNFFSFGHKRIQVHINYDG